MSKTMKAIRVNEFGAPSVLRLCSSVPLPRPGPRQVLIRVRACGVNPVEAYVRSGMFPVKPSLPYTPGSDAAGVVEAVGEGVSALKAGDRVYTTATVTGAYAEFTVAADDCVHKLAGGLDFTQGAAMGVPYFTAYRALIHKSSAKPGQTVLIHGASGGVGVASCQLSRALGLKVLGTAGTAEGMKLVLKNGAHLAFNHREKDYTDKIMEATGGRGVDVIVEMVAHVNLSTDLRMLAPGGRVMVVGSGGPVEINPADAMFKEVGIKGVSLFSATPEEKRESAAFLYAGMEAGWLRPVIGSEHALEEAAQAHQHISQSPGAAGKVVLTV